MSNDPEPVCWAVRSSKSGVLWTYRSKEDAERFNAHWKAPMVVPLYEHPAPSLPEPTCVMCSKPLPVACTDCAVYTFESAGVPRVDPDQIKALTALAAIVEAYDNGATAYLRVRIEAARALAKGQADA